MSSYAKTSTGSRSSKLLRCLLVYEYNDTDKATKGRTPCLLNDGDHLSRSTVSLARGLDRVPAVLNLLGDMRTPVEEAKHHTSRGPVTQKADADARRRDERSVVGDKVWLKALEPSVPTPVPVGPTSRRRATTHAHSLVVHAARR